MSPTSYKILAVLLLAGIAVHRFSTLRKPEGVGAYHERVRQAAHQIPRLIDGWFGEEIPVPARAISVLDPNVIISKRFLNVENGITAGFLLVHCGDAHDMVGHYPLRCYPAQGWDLESSRQREWAAGDLVVTGMEYEFSFRPRDGPARRLIVANCLLRPGQMLRDMESLSASIRGAGGQAMGAGQFQVHFDANVPVERRDAGVRALVAGHRAVLEAILAGTGAGAQN